MKIAINAKTTGAWLYLLTMLVLIFVLLFTLVIRPMMHKQTYKNLCAPMKIIEIKYGGFFNDKDFIGCLKDDGSVKYIEINK